MRTIGSLTLCRSLLTAGLVDRFRVVVFPVITGSTGRDRIYDDYPDVSLEMLGSRTFDGRLQLVEYKPTVLTGLPRRGRRTVDRICGGAQAISRRRPSSAASRSRRSRLRSAQRPDARSSRRVRTALCSASGPTRPTPTFRDGRARPGTPRAGASRPRRSRNQSHGTSTGSIRAPIARASSVASPTREAATSGR